MIYNLSAFALSDSTLTIFTNGRFELEVLDEKQIVGERKRQRERERNSTSNNYIQRKNL